jgi:hypothetical protein
MNSIVKYTGYYLSSGLDRTTRKNHILTESPKNYLPEIKYQDIPSEINILP